MITINTSSYASKVADHYGTQPNLGSPSQNADGPTTDLFKNTPGDMTGRELEELWKPKKKKKKKKKVEPFHPISW